jgi:hypothetical protein
MKHANTLARSAAAALLCLLAGCLQASKVAGGTSETTNGVYSASVAYADGKPAAHARVYVVDGGDWAAKVAEGRSMILDSAVADAQGGFQVKLEKDQRCNLQIDGGRGALFLRDVPYPEADADAPARSLTALSPASLSGRIQADSGTVRELRLSGTAYVSKVGADGAYAFPAIAPGAFDLIAVETRNGAVTAVAVKTVVLAAGQDSAGLDVDMASQRVLVNGFEEEFWFQTALGGMAGGGWAAEKSGSASIQTRISAAAGEAYAGKSLIADMMFQAGDPSAKARVGFSLDASIDLSKMSAVSLHAMGTGRVYLRFHSRALNALSGDSVQFQYPIDLHSQWTRVSIPVASLALTENAPAALQGYAWADAAKDILEVDFVALPAVPAGSNAATQSLGLDDIVFEGVSLKDLKP